MNADSTTAEEPTQVVKAKRRGRPPKAESGAAETATQEELDAAAEAELERIVREVEKREAK